MTSTGAGLGARTASVRQRPPVRGVRRPPPPPVTSLVGRTDALDALARLLSTARLVTLHGPGGVGKTRLALEAVARADAGGVWVDLAAVSAGDAVPYALADALGVRELDPREPAGTLARAVGTAPTLLVVDNCEHVLEDVAPLLDALVRRCPALVVLATSREPLGVEGEHLLPVRPLPTAGTAGGVQLLADRLGAARGRPLDEEESATAVAVVTRLDGLPLAVELAAARAGSLGLEELARRVGLDVLNRGPRSRAPRHRDLRATIGWSVAMLDPAERALFARMSVFAGDVRVERIVAVCADERVPARSTASLVAGLVDRSLVAEARAGRGRGHRLLAPLREFAAEQLAADGETARWQLAHARHLAEVAEGAAAAMHTPDEAAATAALVDDLDDLRAAHEAAARHGDAGTALRLAARLHDLASRQVRQELFDRADAASRLPGAAAHELHPVVLGTAAKGAWLRGDLADAMDRADRALAACPDPQDPRRVRAALARAEVALVSGRLPDAVAAYEHAAALAERTAQTGPACDAWGGLAMTLADRGDVDAGLEAAQRSAAHADASGVPSHRAWALYAEGRCRAAAGDPAAEELLQRSADVAASVRNRSTYLSAATRLLVLRSAEGDPRDQLRAYADTVDRWQRTGSRTFLWVTLRNLAGVLTRVDRREPARALQDAADGALRLDADPGRHGGDAELEAALALATATLHGIVGADPAPAGGWEVRAGVAVPPVALQPTAAAPTAGPPTALAPGVLPPRDQVVVRQDGDVWRLAYAGTTVHVPDRKGMRDLAVLLERPGREVSALDLQLGSSGALPPRPAADRAAGEEAVHTPGDLGEVIDETARAAYRARVEQLRGELDDADAAGDPARGARAQAELDALLAQLRTATGLGGRVRRAGDPEERARSAVGWRIRHAIATVERVHPELGAHLRRTVRLGRSCTYDP